MWILLLIFLIPTSASAAEVVRPLYNAPIVVQKQFELPQTPPMPILPSQPPLQVERSTPRPTYPIRPLDHLDPR